jgi:hypothetical protein
MPTSGGLLLRLARRMRAAAAQAPLRPPPFVTFFAAGILFDKNAAWQAEGGSCRSKLPTDEAAAEAQVFFDM